MAGARFPSFDFYDPDPAVVPWAHAGPVRLPAERCRACAREATRRVWVRWDFRKTIHDAVPACEMHASKAATKFRSFLADIRVTDFLRDRETAIADDKAEMQQ